MNGAGQEIGSSHNAGPMNSAPGMWDITWRSLIKDLRLEWRSKDAINSMLFFSLLVVVIFSFAFNPDARKSRARSPAA